LPAARKSRSAAPISCSFDRPEVDRLPRSSTINLIRESLFAASTASITSFSRVSGAGPPEAWPRARRRGSLESCSTSSPSGAITKAALFGTVGTEVWRAARTKPKMTSRG